MAATRTAAKQEKIAGYPVHPAAALFPMLDDAALKELAADIKKNGQVEPIWLTTDGQVLDGRNRLAACKLARVQPVFRTWRPAQDESAAGVVVSLNLQRRHLTPSQRAALAVQLESMYTEEARQRALEGARKGGAVTAAKRSGKPAPVFSNEERVTPTRVGAKASGGVIDPFAGRSRDQAAKALNVSSGYVSQAKKIAKEAPEVFEKVKTGQLTLPQAKREIDPDAMRAYLERQENNPIGKAKPSAPRRTIKVRKPRNGKVTSSRVTLQLTVTFGSAKVAADVLQVLDDDPRVIKMDHETVG